GTGPGADWYAQRRPRPLSAEEMLAAIQEATGFNLAARASAKPGDGKPSGDLVREVLRDFGEPVDGRGVFQGSLSERLLMNSSGHVRQLLQRRKGNLMDALLSSTAAWEERVDQLYLTVLSRLPREQERKRFVEHLTSDPQKPEPLVEEAIWVLLTCSEFRFNH